MRNQSRIKIETAMLSLGAELAAARLKSGVIVASTVLFSPGLRVKEKVESETSDPPVWP
jgi:hypothetical protein